MSRFIEYEAISVQFSWSFIGIYNINIFEQSFFLMITSVLINFSFLHTLQIKPGIQHSGGKRIDPDVENPCG